MRTTSKFLLGGLSLCLALPVMAAQPNRLSVPMPPPVDSVKKITTIEVIGTLTCRPVVRHDVAPSIWAGRQWVGYVVRVNGQEYLLQMDGGKLATLAAMLNGQRVAVTGRLESWSDHAGCVGGPRTYPLIVVTDLRRVAVP